MNKIHTIIWLTIVITISCNSPAQKDQFTIQRESMVTQQIEWRGIKDQKVLDAMLKVKRHLFVPNEYQIYAYNDNPLPIGYGQTISQPYIVAFMTEVLNLEKTEKVLEIGTGSGYQAAILAEIVDTVYTIEIVKELGEEAKKVLKKLEYHNVSVRIGDGYEGWKEHAPFDAIIVTCAPTHVPEKLKEQLAEGGRMIIPVGESNVQNLYLLRKKDGEIITESILPVRFVPMVDEEKLTY